MLPILKSRDLIGYVDGTLLCPPKHVASSTNVNHAYSTWVQQDQMILSWINKSLTASVLSVQRYASTSQNRILFLRNELLQTKKCDLSVVDYLDRMNVIADNLALAGQPVSRGGGRSRGAILHSVAWLKEVTTIAITTINRTTQFKAKVENMLNCTIKTLQCDEGGEYKSHAFQHFLAAHVEGGAKASFDAVGEESGAAIDDEAEIGAIDVGFAEEENKEWDDFNDAGGEDFEAHSDQAAEFQGGEVDGGKEEVDDGLDVGEREGNDGRVETLMSQLWGFHVQLCKPLVFKETFVFVFWKFCICVCKPFVLQESLTKTLQGTRVGLDLGNYERFLDVTLTRDNNITTGKIYQFFVFEKDGNVITEVCNREGKAGIINPGFEGFQKLFFGQEEIAIPVHSNIEASCAAHPTADVLINFGSYKSAVASSMAALKQPTIKVVAIIAEGVPESDTKQLIAYVVIGPATVGGIQAGAFKIGDTAGTIDNIIHCKLYTPGSVAFVSKFVVQHIIDVIKTWVESVSVISIDGKEGPANVYVGHWGLNLLVFM
ncbi:hypothetical protein D8674_032344 [Pyrus ussuriensis x Pyrus communis]|uniref:CTP synthase N-terminal domain-containing protein n=1 Tax=Pyrus ussuriensis x Pyrus communis TaxID=2448454 RepID=A0A5N5FEK6_9ROSA|nr:hypothetical protein D8674_032344 [Pyrus ussuriensis x Pyrus communis]